MMEAVELVDERLRPTDLVEVRGLHDPVPEADERGSGLGGARDSSSAASLTISSASARIFASVSSSIAGVQALERHEA